MNQEGSDNALDTRQPELLAPAGDFAALMAALDAGATAVYFGLGTLNARRYAKNFAREEYARAVAEVHARGAKAYLTLNVDLAERELGLAARTLAWAAACGADAVLVRDPALLALKPALPEIHFHFSTQNCVSSSADVAAARELGIARAVLAREMTLDEIRAASAVEGVETEVFVQGALCFSISGRCLLSSWVGGRSGNRGACTSPCRVPWTAGGEPLGTPFSMHDLAAVERLDALRAAGVAGLKIEGRMKNADWVGRAVALYRAALDGQPIERLLEEAARLADYAGRQVTCGYLDAKRDELTGAAGRPASGAAEAFSATSRASTSGGKDIAPDGLSDDETDDEADDEPDDQADDEPAYRVGMDVTVAGVEVECACAGYVERWTLPKTVVRRPEKAITVGQYLHWQAEQAIDGSRAERLETNDPDFLIVPRVANGLAARIAAAVRRGRKRPDGLIAIDLPAPLGMLLGRDEPSAANSLRLGDPPDRVRLEASAVARFARRHRPRGILVEGATEGSLDGLRKAAGKAALVVALPPVFFEGEIARLRRLLVACKRASLTVEVNSWGGWHLARQAGVRMEGGPGMAVLNSLAARQLAALGLRGVTLSVEADRRQLEDLSAHCPAPCSLVVYGRPALWTSRAGLPGEWRDRVFVDRRDVRIRARREGGLWVFRPVEPFDLRDLANDRIRAAHLVVDLVGSGDPVAEFSEADVEGDRPRGRFNYDRGRFAACRPGHGGV